MSNPRRSTGTTAGFTADSGAVTTGSLVKYWIGVGGILRGGFGTKSDLRFLLGCSITLVRSTLVREFTGSPWRLFCAIIHALNGVNRKSRPMVVTRANIR